MPLLLLLGLKLWGGAATVWLLSIHRVLYSLQSWVLFINKVACPGHSCGRNCCFGTCRGSISQTALSWLPQTIDFPAFDSRCQAPSISAVQDSSDVGSFTVHFAIVALSLNTSRVVGREGTLRTRRCWHSDCLAPKKLHPLVLTSTGEGVKRIHLVLFFLVSLSLI